MLRGRVAVEVEDSTEALYIIHDHNRGGTDLDEALMDSNEKKERQKGNQENT